MSDQANNKPQYMKKKVLAAPSLTRQTADMTDPAVVLYMKFIQVVFPTAPIWVFAHPTVLEHIRSNLSQVEHFLDLEWIGHRMPMANAYYSRFWTTQLRRYCRSLKGVRIDRSHRECTVGQLAHETNRGCPQPGILSYVFKYVNVPIPLKWLSQEVMHFQECSAENFTSPPFMPPYSDTGCELRRVTEVNLTAQARPTEMNRLCNALGVLHVSRRN